MEFLDDGLHPDPVLRPALGIYGLMFLTIVRINLELLGQDEALELLPRAVEVLVIKILCNRVLLTLLPDEQPARPVFALPFAQGSSAAGGT